MTEVLFDELRDARFTFPQMETSYLQGVEDLADKAITLIYDSNFSITLEELVAFLEAEKVP